MTLTVTLLLFVNLISFLADQWLDVGWVILVDAKTGQVFSGASGGIIFETKFVEEAKTLGWDKHTAGDLIAKAYACDPKDPHAFLTNGKVCIPS